MSNESTVSALESSDAEDKLLIRVELHTRHKEERGFVPIVVRLSKWLDSKHVKNVDTVLVEIGTSVRMALY